MKKIMLFLGISIFSLSQDLSQKNQNSPISHALNTASFINYGTSGYEIDGFIEFQIKNKFFLETSINYEIGNRLSLNFKNDQVLSFNSSVGAMKSVTKSLNLIGGFSNYNELNNDNLNELFVGMISKYLTGVLYLGIEESLAPNCLGIIDINSFLKNNIPVDISIMITYTTSSIEG